MELTKVMRSLASRLLVGKALPCYPERMELSNITNGTGHSKLRHISIPEVAVFLLIIQASSEHSELGSPTKAVSNQRS